MSRRPKKSVPKSRRTKRKGVGGKEFLPVRAEIVAQKRFERRSVIATRKEIHTLLVIKVLDESSIGKTPL
jgi:hypothetical protein